MKVFSAKFTRLPVLIRVFIYLGVNYLLIAVSQIITGLLHANEPVVFNFVLCVLLLLFTRFVLRLENKSFKDIGVVIRSRPGWLQLAAGFVTGVAMLLVTAWILKKITGFEWIKNTAFDLKKGVLAFVTFFISVFVQELAFRGYPFRLLLDKYGIWTAQLIMAVLFGCMHLHEGMSVREVLLTMVNTGAGAVLFGMTVIRTGRLHLAVGLHFGWNYAQFLFPRHPSLNGDGLLLVQGGHFDTNVITWVAPYIVVLAATYLLIRYSFNPHSILKKT